MFMQVENLIDLRGTTQQQNVKVWEWSLPYKKNCHYLLANPFIFYTYDQTLKYLVNKPLHHDRIFC